MSTRSPIETRLAEALRAALDGVAVGDAILDSPHLPRVLSAWEWYLPAILREAHAEWGRGESLDGVFLEDARKIGDRQAEIAGQCILISDQTLTPYHVSIRVASAANEIESLDCKLGEVRNGEMARIPYASYHPKGKYSVAGRLDVIQWKYHVGF